MKTLPPCESAVTTFLKSPDDNVARELVALANTLGGDLYVGVDPAGRVAGVPELDRAEMRILPQRRIPSKRQPRRDSFSDIQSAGLPPVNGAGQALQKPITRPCGHQDSNARAIRLRRRPCS